jgi:predicted O-methyltransferase YrrM
MIGARRVLEIGTLGGYSTIWLARALPADGKIVTLELEPRHAEAARRNFATAGVANKIEVIVGPRRHWKRCGRKRSSRSTSFLSTRTRRTPRRISAPRSNFVIPVR